MDLLLEFRGWLDSSGALLKICHLNSHNQLIWYFTWKLCGWHIHFLTLVGLFIFCFTAKWIWFQLHTCPGTIHFLPWIVAQSRMDSDTNNSNAWCYTTFSPKQKFSVDRYPAFESPCLPLLAAFSPCASVDRETLARFPDLQRFAIMERDTGERQNFSCIQIARRVRLDSVMHVCLSLLAKGWAPMLPRCRYTRSLLAREIFRVDDTPPQMPAGFCLLFVSPYYIDLSETKDTRQRA